MFKCTDCNKNKELSEFHKNKSQPNGHANICRECWHKMAKLRDPNTRHLAYLRNRPRQKNSELISTYGITLERFNQMRASQDFLCGICGKHETDSNKGLHIDHCHETKRVRGLLCNSCNLAIGQLKHNVTILRKAIEYLERQ
jgi:hypothetical protein